MREGSSGEILVATSVENGTITFSDPNQIDPFIDIQARAWVQNYQITVRLTGTLDRLVPTVSSDPPLEEAGIYSLLALGHRNEAVGGGAIEQTGRSLQERGRIRLADRADAAEHLGELLGIQFMKFCWSRCAASQEGCDNKSE